MFEFRNLNRVNIKGVIVSNLFCCVPDDKCIDEIIDEIKIIETAVKIVISNKLDRCILDMDILTEQLFLPEFDYNDFRTVISETQTRAEELYDGFYDRPEILKPEQFFYRVVIQTIYEYGRITDDIAEHVICTNIGELFDEDIVDDEYDMHSWSLLLEYLDDALQGRTYPFSKFLKERNCSPKRMQGFLHRQVWYKEPADFGEIFGIERDKPSMKEIIAKAVELLQEEYKLCKERNN